jgi:hypothetical protein
LPQAPPPPNPDDENGAAGEQDVLRAAAEELSRTDPIEGASLLMDRLFGMPAVDAWGLEECMFDWTKNANNVLLSHICNLWYRCLVRCRSSAPAVRNLVIPMPFGAGDQGVYARRCTVL